MCGCYASHICASQQQTVEVLLFKETWDLASLGALGEDLLGIWLVQFSFQQNRKAKRVLIFKKKREKKWFVIINSLHKKRVKLRHDVRG